jgi:SAM-dependent methyltransferase
VWRCRYCGAGDGASLYRGVRDHFGVAPGTYDFVRCTACGAASLDPVPRPDALAGYYPRDYTFRPAAASEPGVRRALRALEWRLFYRPQYRGRLRSIRRLTGLGGGRVLEIGCGSGTFLHMAQRAGFEVAGVDLSVEDAKFAREVLGLDVTEGDLTAVAARSARYDAVFLFYVLEHVADPGDVVRHAHALLRPGGAFVAAVPVLDSGQARLFGARWSQVTEAPRHVTLPTRRGLATMLRAAGFGDVRFAAMPLLDSAGVIVTSVLPGAATPQAYGRDGGALAPLLLRAAAAMLLPLGIAAAAIDRLAGAGLTMVTARKP